MIKEILKFVFLAAWASFFIYLDFYTDLPPRHDDCMYLCLAKSILAGTGYKDISVPASQNIPVLVPTAFPLVLTLYWAFLAPHIMLLKLFLAAILIGGVFIAYIWLARFMPKYLAYFVVLAFSSMYVFVNIGNSLLTEILFVPLLYAGCYFYMHYAEKKSRAAGWFAVIILVALARTRLVGGFFFATILVSFLFNRDWWKFLAGMIGIAIWFVLEQYWAAPTSVHSGGYMSAYINGTNFLANPWISLLGVMDHFLHFVWSIVSSMYANILFPYFYSLVGMNPAKRIIVIIIFLDGCLGAWLLCRQNKAMRMLIAASIVSLIPVLLVSDTTGSMFRYLFPYFPIFSMCALFPILHYTKSSENIVVRFLPGLFIGLIVCNQAISLIRMKDTDPWFPKSERDDLSAMHNFISDSKMKPNVVLSPQKYYAYLKTNIFTYEVRVPDDFCGNRPYLRPGQTILAILNSGYFGAVPKPIHCDSVLFSPESPPLASRGSWSVYRISVIHDANAGQGNAALLEVR